MACKKVISLVRVDKMKDGKLYHDFYMLWRNLKGQVRYNRVRPCFDNDFRYFMAFAIKISKDDKFSDFI